MIRLIVWQRWYDMIRRVVSQRQTVAFWSPACFPVWPGSCCRVRMRARGHLDGPQPAEVHGDGLRGRVGSSRPGISDLLHVCDMGGAQTPVTLSDRRGDRLAPTLRHTRFAPDAYQTHTRCRPRCRDHACIALTQRISKRCLKQRFTQAHTQAESLFQGVEC